MNLLQLLKSWVKYLAVRRDPTFEVPVERQKAFLEKLPEPQDLFERSYAQYRCQMALEIRCIRLLYWLAAMVLLPVYRLRLSHHAATNSGKRADAVFAYAAGDMILPDSMRQEFPGLVQVDDFQNTLCLTEEDLQFLRTLTRRYPMAFYFRFKCMVKLAMYRSLYESYHPRAIIVSEEYSYTSSLLTAYCHHLGVEHINIMHGEKLFYIRDSFFYFDRCYIWDAFYKKLFCELRTEPTQFRVELPLAMKPWKKSDTPPEIDLTYYLQEEVVPGVYARIANALSVLQSQGMTIAVRPHPLVTPPETMSLFRDFQIETSSLSIRDSIFRTKCAVSLYSTVLLQAHINGVEVVIDDLTAPERFAQLQTLHYIMLDKPHRLLSELINEEKI